jgi:hypothetical protein
MAWWDRPPEDSQPFRGALAYAQSSSEVISHRSAEDVHLMALANLHGEYAEVMSCDDVLRRYAMRIA